MMPQLQLNSKLTPSRLARKAIVYLRQSTERQVTHNLESQRLQYGLVDRARALGWEDIEVIDADLGFSAAIGATQRPGFTRLLTAVTMGEVGLVLSRELSRLSRTDKDWCHLLELCQLFDTLIADAEHVYDLGSMDDQLVLGIKGTMSTVELKILRMRMQQGLEAKARRGELHTILAPGYVLDANRKVVKDPDKRVREAIELLFKKFAELASVMATFRWFREQQIALPAMKPKAGSFSIVWQLPTLFFVREAIGKPIYGGAYCYGRRPTETVLVDGQVRKRRGKALDAALSKVFIRDHHEGYIDWQTFEHNLAAIQRNRASKTRRDSTGAWRTGSALLAGMLRCGCCGRKFAIRYPRGTATPGYYRCSGEFFVGGDGCLFVAATALDKRVEEEILQALSPLAVRASVEAVRRSDSHRSDEQTALTRQLEEVKYEAQRAFEQYNEVDPRHRLVAEELERRWNVKLQEVTRIEARIKESAQQHRILNDQDRARLMALGADFSNVWQSAAFSLALKKQIVRVLCEEIVVTAAPGGAEFEVVIRWAGGAHTRFALARSKSRTGQPNAIEDIELIRRMAARYADAEIARVLSMGGSQTGKNRPWTARSVATARSSHAIDGQKRRSVDPEILSRSQAEAHCKVSSTTIKQLVREKILPMHQVAPHAPWEIRKADLETPQVRARLATLRRTGKLMPKGTNSNDQIQLL